MQRGSAPKSYVLSLFFKSVYDHICCILSIERYSASAPSSYVFSLFFKSVYDHSYAAAEGLCGQVLRLFNIF